MKVVKQRKDGVVQRYNKNPDVHQLIDSRNDLSDHQKEAFHEVASTFGKDFGSDPDYFETWVNRIKKGRANTWVYSDYLRRAALARADYVPSVDEAMVYEYGDNYWNYTSPSEVEKMRASMLSSIEQQVKAATERAEREK